MSKTIQVLKPKFRVDEILSEMKECLEMGWTGIGFKTEKIEEAWKEYSGFQYAHFLNSATSGLHLCFSILKRHYGWTSEDQVITTSLTFVSTNHAILYENLTPVFADVDESLCLDPESVLRAITSKTKAVIYVGLGGNAANYKEIKNICREKGIVLILDAAHMAGTRWVDSSEHVGLDADCAIFSFQAVKNCPSADAGMICFPTSDFDLKARRLSWLGIDKTTYSRYSQGSYKWRYDVNELGYKFHGNSIAAAMCLVSLKYLDQDNDYRRMLAKIYGKLLADQPGIQLIWHSPEIVSSRHLFQIACENRDELMDKLSRNQIYPGVHYVANTSYDLYKSYTSYAKKADFYSQRLISLPLHLDLSEADIERIVSVILE